MKLLALIFAALVAALLWWLTRPRHYIKTEHQHGSTDWSGVVFEPDCTWPDGEGGFICFEPVAETEYEFEQDVNPN